jgi:hypothetical protein
MYDVLLLFLNLGFKIKIRFIIPVAKYTAVGSPKNGPGNKYDQLPARSSPNSFHQKKKHMDTFFPVSFSAGNCLVLTQWEAGCICYQGHFLVCQL